MSPHPITVTHKFTSPEKRVTKELLAKLEQLAPLFMIQVRRLDAHTMELSGSGFAGGEPLVLDLETAKIRLLSELCSILARWISFNFWEPCEITLLSVPEARIERCAFNWRKQLAQQAKAAAKAAAALAAVKSSIGKA